MDLTENKAVLSWIEEMVTLIRPKQGIRIDGSETQLAQLREQAVREGVLEKLNQEKLPGCYLTSSPRSLMSTGSVPMTRAISSGPVSAT